MSGCRPFITSSQHWGSMAMEVGDLLADWRAGRGVSVTRKGSPHDPLQLDRWETESLGKFLLDCLREWEEPK